MKKIYTIAIAALFALAAFSCQKENENITVKEDNENEEFVRISISGTLDKELAKTAYDAEGKMTWLDGDKVALILNNKDNAQSQNRNQYMLEASYGDITENGRNAVFYGMVPAHQNVNGEWLSTGFAVYPVAISQINPSNYYNAPFIKLPSSDSSLGLASSIALVGIPDNETASEVKNFIFKSAMSVLIVNISNIPSAATAIRLSTSNSDAYPVDGDFILVKKNGIVTIDLDSYQGWGNGYQSVDISSEGDIASRDFFFNVPVGTYPAGTLSIEVLGSNNQVLLKRSINKDLNLQRNDCLEVPSMCYHRVYVNGSLSAPGLYTDKPSAAHTIRVHISNQKLTASSYLSDKSNWKYGNRFSGNQSGWNLTQLTQNSGAAFLTSAGTYYLQYIVSSDGSIPDKLSDSSVMAYGSVPFVFVPAANKIPIASSWLNVPYVSVSEGSVAYLVDGNSGTYWHSPYGSEDPARNATYGQIISIDLNEGGLTTDGNLYFSYATRNVYNDHAKSIDIYASNVRWDESGFDSSKVKIGSASNALEGISPLSDLWIKSPIECSGSGSYRYITISILSNYGLTNGSIDLRTSGCTHMAEIEFYTR